MNEILIYARRGGPVNAPENTGAAFRAAFSDGASAAGCEIRRTADGQFVAFRDPSAGRLCGLDWKISGTAWTHLKTLRVLGREPIVHLDDILNLLILRPSKEFYLELALEKEAHAADLALQVSKAGVEGRVFLTVPYRKRGFLKAAAGAIPGIGAALKAGLPADLLNSARAAGASRVLAGWEGALGRQFFYAGAGLFDLERQAQEAQAAGVEISAGVANHPRDVRSLAALGLSAVWTDDVPMAVRYI